MPVYPGARLTPFLPGLHPLRHLGFLPSSDFSPSFAISSSIEDIPFANSRVLRASSSPRWAIASTIARRLVPVARLYADRRSGRAAGPISINARTAGSRWTITSGCFIHMFPIIGSYSMCSIRNGMASTARRREKISIIDRSRFAMLTPAGGRLDQRSKRGSTVLGEATVCSIALALVLGSASARARAAGLCAMTWVQQITSAQAAQPRIDAFRLVIRMDLDTRWADRWNGKGFHPTHGTARQAAVPQNE